MVGQSCWCFGGARGFGFVGASNALVDRFIRNESTALQQGRQPQNTDGVDQVLTRFYRRFAWPIDGTMPKMELIHVNSDAV